MRKKDFYVNYLGALIRNFHSQVLDVFVVKLIFYYVAIRERQNHSFYNIYTRYLHAVYTPVEKEARRLV